MKKIISGVLALLMCASAAGCRNSDAVIEIQTQISRMDLINDPEALESAVAEHISENSSENENNESVTAVSSDEQGNTEQIDTDSVNSENSEEAVQNGAETQVTTGTTAVQNESAQEDDPAENPVESGSFNTAFLKEAAKQNNNFVISPLSVKLALNMAALGAGEDSETERELLDLFGYESREEMISQSSGLISELNRKDGSITVNDSVWISDKKDVSISGEYTKRLEEIFRAEQFRRDLSDKKIVKEFNKWVKKNTNGLIPEMISQPFDETSRMVLVNTLYFKENWETQFPESNSHEIKFFGVNSENWVMAMSMEKDFGYAEGSTFKSVVLPYEDGSKMKAYLPMDENASLAEIIGSLSSGELAKELDLDYSMEETVVCLPRFECDYKDSLVETLKILGISAAFDSGAADFSGMLDGDSEYPLFISEVVHASKIKCGEKGTEAAAATMIAMDTGAAMPVEKEPPKEFIANRPFLYMIESPSGEVLFMGIMSEF